MPPGTGAPSVSVAGKAHEVLEPLNRMLTVPPAGGLIHSRTFSALRDVTVKKRTSSPGGGLSSTVTASSFETCRVPQAGVTRTTRK